MHAVVPSGGRCPCLHLVQSGGLTGAPQLRLSLSAHRLGSPDVTRPLVVAPEAAEHVIDAEGATTSWVSQELKLPHPEAEQR